MVESKKRKTTDSSAKAGGKSKFSPSDKKPKKADASAADFRHPRKHAEDVEQAKRIWNQLRVKTNTAKQNQDYMQQLMPLIKGKAPQVALQHDASRCVQACVQFGTPDERKDLLKEFIAAGMVDLSKNQYACFTVLKMIKYCHTDKDCASLILKSFKGHVPKLCVHAVASRVMGSVFDTFSSKQTAFLKQELYGPHFALFALDDADKSPPTLAANLAKSPKKKEQTLEFVRSIINKGMAKTLYGLGYFQELCAEYVAVVDPVEVRQMTATAADHSIHLLSSKHGARVVASFVSYGTAKDRKRIMKSLKGYSRSGLLHPDAYLAILRLVQLTDDTVSIQKNVLNELTALPEPATTVEKKTEEDKEAMDRKNQQSPLFELALDKRASKLLLMIVMPPGEAREKLFDPYEASFLFPNPTVKEEGQEVPTSRKDPEMRRKELLEFMKDHLIELCSKHAGELLFSMSGAVVLREVYAAFRPASVVDAVVDRCEMQLKELKKDLFDGKLAHHSIRNLLLVDVVSDDSPLATAFLERVGGRLMEIASSSRGAFVVAALCKIPAVKAEATKKVKDHGKELKKLMNAAETKAGYEALFKEVSI